MAKPKSDLLQGTLDLLILKTLALEPMHGWGITQRIQQISDGALVVNQGSLYPALLRLEQQGWIDSEWDVSENKRQATVERDRADFTGVLNGGTLYVSQTISSSAHDLAAEEDRT